MNQSNLSPKERYHRDLKNNQFTYDRAQESAVNALEQLYLDLINRKSVSNTIFLKLSEVIFKPIKRPVKGIYLWGGVGRGKTYLMDSFFNALPFKEKKRLHFHRFMYWVHNELSQMKGIADPMIVIARKLALETKILCFDEFFVSDIGDAMILSNLLQEMFRLEICLVATSNIIPNELYRNGLQRERFLPAIELINTHTEVLNVDGGVDYRLRTLQKAEIYHFPLDASAEKNLAESFSHLAVEEHRKDSLVLINDREIQVRYVSEGVVWLSFESVCKGPRSSNDYIELSKLYHTVIISDIPILSDAINDQVRRFISLVDEFYERNVKLILSAAVSLASLYTGTELRFEFRRTKSRLEEMQSTDYLAREHLP